MKLFIALGIILNTEKKIIFERVKAPKTFERKWHRIELILCHLRSKVYRQLSRCSNMIFFSVLSITLQFLLSPPSLLAEIPSKKNLLDSLCQNKKTQIALLPHASKEWFKASQELSELEEARTACPHSLRPHLHTPETLPLNKLASHPELKTTLDHIQRLAEEYQTPIDNYYPNIDLYTLLDCDTLSLQALISHKASPSVFFAYTPSRPMEATATLEWERTFFNYTNQLLNTIKETLIPLSTLRALVEQKRIHEHLIETAINHYTLCFFRFSQGKLDYIAVLEAEQDLLQERLIECDLYEEEQLALTDISYLFENR